MEFTCSHSVCFGSHWLPSSFMHLGNMPWGVKVSVNVWIAIDELVLKDSWDTHALLNIPPAYSGRWIDYNNIKLWYNTLCYIVSSVRVCDRGMLHWIQNNWAKQKNWSCLYKESSKVRTRFAIWGPKTNTWSRPSTSVVCTLFQAYSSPILSSFSTFLAQAVCVLIQHPALFVLRKHLTCYSLHCSLHF